MEYTYPWPHPKLNPNKNTHWRAKAPIKAKAKNDAYHLTRTYIKPSFPEYNIHLKITFFPPTKRKYDLDNQLAAMKSTLDGIAEAWDIDDRRFNQFTIEMSRSVVPGGQVKISIIS